MVNIVTGARDTDNITQDRRKVDMADKIVLLNPNANPFTLLSQKVAKKKAINPKYSWMEDDIRPAWDNVNLAGGYTASDTSIVVDNGDYFQADNLVKVPRTGEVFEVTAVSTNTLTISRAVGSSSAGTLEDDEPLMILADATEEGDNARSAKSTLVDTEYNYTQITRTSVQATATEEASEMYGGKDRSYQRNKSGIEHAIKMERALWFGERGIDTSGTHPKRYTGGVLEYLNSNVSDAGGMLTEVEFENWVRTLFSHGSDIKWGFASPLVLSVISMWGRNKLQMVPKDKTYGLSVTKYISPHGELNLVKNKLFEGDTYGGYIVGLDFEDECVGYRFLQGRDTKLKTNIQTDKEDGWMDEYITEYGLQFKQPDRHAVLTGITG